jgi:ribosomal-protein-alanine N-acetyltransferase
MIPPTIETERLTLRPFTESDIAPLVEAVISNPDVMNTLPSGPQKTSQQIQCAKKYIDDYSSSWPKYGYGGWAVCSRDGTLAISGKLLGFCGFELGHLEGFDAEIGFGFRNSVWGRGVGYEAALASVNWFFTEGNFSNFYACFFPGNNGSKRILEKLGMTFYGEEDLWDSVEKGIGRLPVYDLGHKSYFANRG